MLPENYKWKTTFGPDFSIADMFGEEAVKDTYKRGLEYAKTDYQAMAEFTCILNWKCWQWNEKDESLSRLYANLYYKARNLCFSKLFTKEEQSWIYDFLD